MKIEEQVCSLELSKKLKELGVKGDSLFKWHGEKDTWEIKLSSETSSNISAYTVAELGEKLWEAFEKIGWKYIYVAYGEVFDYKGTQYIGELGIINLMRRPVMGAKLLIYLKESKLI